MTPMPRTLWFIDLIEEASAVLIDPKGALREIPTSALPDGAREGMAFFDLKAAPHEAPDCSRGSCVFEDERAIRERRERIATVRRGLMGGDDGEMIRL
jgi:hypothetical protein